MSPFQISSFTIGHLLCMFLPLHHPQRHMPVDLFTTICYGFMAVLLQETLSKARSGPLILPPNIGPATLSLHPLVHCFQWHQNLAMVAILSLLMRNHSSEREFSYCVPSAASNIMVRYLVFGTSDVPEASAILNGQADTNLSPSTFLLTFTPLSNGTFRIEYAASPLFSLPDSSPTLRHHASAAMFGKTLVLYGGFDMYRRPLDDFWILIDGGMWVQLKEPKAPPARGFACMVSLVELDGIFEVHCHHPKLLSVARGLSDLGVVCSGCSKGDGCQCKGSCGGKRGRPTDGVLHLMGFSVCAAVLL